MSVKAAFVNKHLSLKAIAAVLRRTKDNVL